MLWGMLGGQGMGQVRLAESSAARDALVTALRLVSKRGGGQHGLGPGSVERRGAGASARSGWELKYRPRARAVEQSSFRPSRRSGRGVMHPSRVLRYRNVVENTLADTPSGYIQDPRAHPAQMVTYTKPSRASEAALQALETERQLLEKEELAYKGFTTLAIQEAKRTVMNPSATTEALAAAAATLQREEEHLRPLVGTEAERPVSPERIVMLKWQQRQGRLADRNMAFRVPSPEPPDFHVRIAEDGTEEVVLRRQHQDKVGRRGEQSGKASSTAADASSGDGGDGGGLAWEDGEDGEDEELDPALLAPERVLVTQTDVNHVRYVRGLALRRLRRFAEAEGVLMDILRSDVRNVDAVESLLELYTGLDDGEKVQSLFCFLEEEFETAAKEGRLTHVDHEAPPASEAELENSPSEAGELPPGETTLPDGRVVLAEGTQPLLTPLQIAISVLADMIVEGATRHCAEHGEGSTSRFFLESLSPMGKWLDRTHMAMLIETLFRSLDEQHYVARFELDAEALARDDNLIYSVVISFLKMLLVTKIPSMLEEPIRFRFMILSKLHSALRSCGRKAESYRFCEDMLKLYRANSAVYLRRGAAMEGGRRAGQSPRTVGEGARATEQERSTSTTSRGERAAEDDAATMGGTSSHVPSSLALDDMDGSYRISLFQYLNDRAMDSAAVGRELCLAAMEEFPEAAAPWETLALILHREDPKGNLRDAILAARHGLRLEPFNLSLILTCANLYKADHRYALHELLLDRYRLLCYMLENSASDADVRAVADEVLAAEQSIAETAEDASQEEARFQQERLQDQPKLLRAMEDWSRLHSETRSPRTYTHQQPVTVPSQELGISKQRPAEMNQDFRDANDALGRRGGGGDGPM